MKVILASKSPRRKELLDLLQIPFEIIVSEIDETINLKGDLKKEIENLAYRKAQKVFETNQDAIVVGSDTIVVIDNEVLGKPKDKKDAFRMLKMLSGNTHEVITGVCLLSKSKKDTFSSTTKVKFNDLSDEEILKAMQDESYSIEFLWTKIGNHATSQGVNLKFEIVSSTTGANNVNDINFTVQGTYIGITNFIYAIENDEELNFRIQNFKLLPHDGNVLQGTFTVRNISIQGNTSSQSVQGNASNNSTNTQTNQQSGNTQTNQQNTNTQNTNTNTQNTNTAQ